MRAIPYLSFLLILGLILQTQNTIGVLTKEAEEIKTAEVIFTANERLNSKSRQSRKVSVFIMYTYDVAPIDITDNNYSVQIYKKYPRYIFHCSLLC